MKRWMLAGVIGVAACDSPNLPAPKPPSTPRSARPARALVLLTPAASNLGDRSSSHSLAAAYVDDTPVFFECESDDAGYGSVGIVPEHLVVPLETPSERTVNCAGKCPASVDVHVLARRWAFRALMRTELKGACASAQYSVIRLDYGVVDGSSGTLPAPRSNVLGDAALAGLTPVRVLLAPIQVHSETWAFETVYPCEPPLVLRHEACRPGRTSPFACRQKDSSEVCESQCSANDLLSCFNAGLRAGVNSDDGRAYMRKACAANPLLCKYALIPRIGAADSSELMGLAEAACAHGLGHGCEFLVYSRKPVTFSATDGMLIRACEAGASAACHDLAQAQLAAGDRESALVSYHRACMPGAEEDCSRYAALRAVLGK